MSDKVLTWGEAVQWLRAQPDKREVVHHCYYDDPLDIAAERFNNSEEWLAVKHLLRTYIPGKVLDIGAGRGISSYAFAKTGCQVTALEPNPSLLVGTQAIQFLVDNNQLPIQIIQEYGEALPFQDNSFDIVYGRAILHHASDLRKLCQEAARVLKPGGVFIATREHVISRKEDLKLFLDSHLLHFLYLGENAYLLEEYTDAIKAAGLKFQKVIGSFESVINYAPMTQQELEAKITSLFTRRVNNRLTNWLATTGTVQQFCAWYLSQKSDTPGRHYSFLAIKK